VTAADIQTTPNDKCTATSITLLDTAHAAPSYAAYTEFGQTERFLALNSKTKSSFFICKYTGVEGSRPITVYDGK